MKKNILIVVLITLGILITSFLPILGQYHTASAASFNFSVLGGPILAIRVCTCSGNQLLTIGPPRSGDFLFQPGTSILFSFRSIKVGSNVIGLAGPTPIACMVYAGITCVNAGKGKPILIIGTSK